jgi:hypothetical protein
MCLPTVRCPASKALIQHLECKHLHLCTRLKRFVRKTFASPKTVSCAALITSFLILLIA